jgi:hypothetical protein
MCGDRRHRLLDELGFVSVEHTDSQGLHDLDGQRQAGGP